ncbi:protein CEBPZOS-like [Ascaphus truei]|uniref:protein CEBPZOS-like n=1 Tax=Ascaphus truei TaxID=8439 RepID=UPI003F5A18DF
MEPVAKKILKGIILLEVAGVVGSYALFHKLNVSQDFRYTMNRRFPSVLEGFFVMVITQTSPASTKSSNVGLFKIVK